jgi:hypothetical protein
MVLRLWSGRWKLAGLRLILKAALLVSTVAERLICRMAAATELNSSAASQTILVALHIVNLEIAFDEQRAVIPRGNFGGHFFSRVSFVKSA